MNFFEVVFYFGLLIDSFHWIVMSQPSFIKFFLFSFVPLSSLLFPISFSFFQTYFWFMVMMQIMEPVLSFWSMAMTLWTYVIVWTFNIFVMIWTVFSLIRDFPFRLILLLSLNDFRICSTVWIWRFAIIRAFKNVFHCFCLRLSIRHVGWTVLIHSKKVSFWNKFLTITLRNIIVTRRSVFS